jgi:OOP family OmpA-OmpF porin
MNLPKNFHLISTSLAFSALILSACSTIPANKYQYAADANPADELKLMDVQLQAAITNQLDVLSPAHFAVAQDKMKDAHNDWEKNHNGKETLSDLGDARGQLDAATTVADTGRREIPEVIQARSAAVQANARMTYTNQLKEVDHDLTGYTKNLETGKMSMSSDDRSKLQNAYLDVELKAIIHNRLGNARKMIDDSRNLDAAKWAPNTLSSAEAYYKAAVTTITTNRHDDTAVNAAVDTANQSATKLLSVSKMANDTRGPNSESVALEMYRQKQSIAKQSSQLDQQSHTLNAQGEAITQQNSMLNSQGATLAAQGATLAAQDSQLKSANAKLSFNETLADAQKRFSPSEAEVYRQGDQLLIRLKDIKFPTNSAVLPTASEGTLSKVKEVIANLGADKVMVEGHTDSIGSKELNHQLSEKRAETVANYLVQENAINQNQVETKGYGFDKPLTDNKTASGRATNRRVDILITPTSMQ